MGHPLLFPGIIPRMHVLTRLHLWFLHACPKKAIFLLEFRQGVHVIQYALVLSFSPSNLSAAFFSNTTFQLLVNFCHHLSLKSVCNRSKVKQDSKLSILVCVYCRQWPFLSSSTYPFLDVAVLMHLLCISQVSAVCPTLQRLVSI